MFSNSPALSRRHFLWRSGGGLGGIALAWLLDRDARAASGFLHSPPRPHFAPKAKRIVQIFCAGGVSHIDTFDHKPELIRQDGKPLEGRGELRGFFGQAGNLMRPQYEFSQHGQSGAWVSSLLPHLATCVDDIAFIHSMVAKSNNHTPATFQMNTGFTMNGFPSMGAWLSYGLGNENQDLPTFVVLPDGRGLPAGGSINWTAGFLPASHQGVPFRTGSTEPIVDWRTPADVSPAARRASSALLAQINREFAQANPGTSEIAARLRAYELAANMQVSVPEAVDIESESEETKALYGLDVEGSRGFGQNCLMARRLLERGVRFVQLFNGGAFGSPRINWDGHEDLKRNHDRMAASMDQPVAGLIKDLKRRGLLEDTLLVWATEFGRGPNTQGLGKPGRDHHPDAFTVFMAGAGVKKGVNYGASDEIGFSALDPVTTIPDLHATILHLLGLNHEELTYYHNGIKRRLTNVSGEPIQGILS